MQFINYQHLLWNQTVFSIEDLPLSCIHSFYMIECCMCHEMKVPLASIIISLCWIIKSPHHMLSTFKITTWSQQSTPERFLQHTCLFFFAKMIQGNMNGLKHMNRCCKLVAFMLIVHGTQHDKLTNHSISLTVWRIFTNPFGLQSTKICWRCMCQLMAEKVLNIPWYCHWKRHFDAQVACCDSKHGARVTISFIQKYWGLKVE